MAMYKVVGDKESLASVPETSFAQENFLEREDLQRMLRDQPDVLESDLLIVSEEFSSWQDSGRSIDLLGLDADGRLTVIELKRTATGDHAELQAIRYAAMVANLTFDQIVKAHEAYLSKRGIEEDAQALVLQHLGVSEPEDAEISTERPRIILGSGGFSKELTTSVLWLNYNYDLDIRCIRLQPYRNGQEILLETSQVIPLPEAEDYLVKVRQREKEVQPVVSEPGQKVPGGSAFKDRIPSAHKDFQPQLERLYDWAARLEQDGLAELKTYIGKDTTLQVRVPEQSALLSIYSRETSVSVVFWTKRFRVSAPASMLALDKAMGTNVSGTPNSTVSRTLREVPDYLVTVLQNAYREASGWALVDESVDNTVDEVAES